MPDMAVYLRDSALQTSVEAALWAIFHRSSNPSVTELMNQVGRTQWVSGATRPCRIPRRPYSQAVIHVNYLAEMTALWPRAAACWCTRDS